MKNDIVSKNYSEFINMPPKTQENEKTPFTNNEIEMLWNIVQKRNDDYVQIVLMLIYSGLRISELLNLKKRHVHLDKQYIEIVHSKTQAGIRKVPIAKKTLPFFDSWMNKRTEFEFLLFNKKGDYFLYNHYLKYYWIPLMEIVHMEHKPHETRHTTISLLALSNTNPTFTKLIVGHAGAMSMTEKIYTHIEVEPLIEAIDKI